MMNNSIAYIHDGLASHPVASLFHISIRLCERGHLVLALSRCSQAPVEYLDSAGVCNFLIDYAARKAGHNVIGRCYIAECETSLYYPVQAHDISAEVSIESGDINSASYLCKLIDGIHVIAESQGTLVSSGTLSKHHGC